MDHTKPGFPHLGLAAAGLEPSLITLQSRSSHCWHYSETTTRLKQSPLSTTGTLQCKTEMKIRNKLCLKTAEVSQASGLRCRAGEDFSHLPPTLLGAARYPSSITLTACEVLTCTTCFFFFKNPISSVTAVIVI